MEFIISVVLFIGAVLFYLRIWGMADQLKRLIDLGEEEKKDRQAIMRRQAMRDEEEEARRTHVSGKTFRAANPKSDTAFESAIADEMAGPKTQRPLR